MRRILRILCRYGWHPFALKVMRVGIMHRYCNICGEDTTEQ